MKELWERCREYKLWFLLLLLTDVMTGLFLWMSGRVYFKLLSGLFFFFSMVLFLAAVWFTGRWEQKREEKVLEFYGNPDLVREEEACRLLPARERHQLHEAGKILQEKEEQARNQKLEREAYEAYIESWAHEVKTPLSLMALVLDNRREEMEPGVYRKLEYARNQIQENVGQILAYARLKAEHKDYFLEKLSLRSCLEEMLEEYRILLEEQDFELQMDVPDVKIMTDRRSLLFLTGQAVGNAVKYKKQDGTRPVLAILAEVMVEERVTALVIRDNGIGVKGSDLPFIFDRGFTGDTGEERKKSTGMGLYLVEQIAGELHIGVDADSTYGEGFELRFFFAESE